MSNCAFKGYAFCVAKYLKKQMKRDYSLKILTISGSYRKGKTVETLIDKAIDGALSLAPDAQVEKIRLIEKKIEYCKCCYACKKDKETEIGKCIIDDDMTEIYKQMNEADAYILGSPIMHSDMSAVMKTFIERGSWTMAKECGIFPVKMCPVSRNPRKRRSIFILSAGGMPPLFRMFCDNASSTITSFLESCLNAKPVGSMYAGAVEYKGMERYFDQAYDLGRRLARKSLLTSNSTNS